MRTVKEEANLIFHGCKTNSLIDREAIRFRSFAIGQSSNELHRFIRLSTAVIGDIVMGGDIEIFTAMDEIVLTHSKRFDSVSKALAKRRKLAITQAIKKAR